MEPMGWPQAAAQIAGMAAIVAVVWIMYRYTFGGD